MARKRMIDPNIWQSEDFSKLNTLAKLVFIGLFSLADDEGKGRCNPVYLKSTLFPYDEGIRSTDIDKTLFEISSNMSILFYSCNGSNYYRLINWSTWQKIDKPSKSKIPNYDENTMQVLFDDNSANVRRVVSPNKNRTRKEDKLKEIEEKRREVVETYNKFCTELPLCLKQTDKRNKQIDVLLKNFTIEQFGEICTKANSSNFLVGKNDRNWKADIDFLLRTDKATNVLEGKYDNSTNNAKNVLEEAYLKAKQEEGGDIFENNN